MPFSFLSRDCHGNSGRLAEESPRLPVPGETAVQVGGLPASATRAPQAAGPGLVSSQTSGIPAGAIHVDPVLARVQRMRRRVLTGARLHVAQVLKWRAAMLTLTYRPDLAWDGRHVSECHQFTLPGRSK